MSRNNLQSSELSPDSAQKVRLDKWLWAARFFKTRNLAKQAVEGGKVHCNGQRCKSSREVAIGQVLTIRQGWDEKTVVVRGLSEKRQGASVAGQLYEETPESLEKRRLAAEQRKAGKSMNPTPVTPGRPTKKDRRLIHRFKRNM